MNLATGISRSALSPFCNSFAGRLLLPSDDGYEVARRVHNGMIDRRPSIIACCMRSADVVDALDFAIEHGLQISVRGGGHNVAGRAVIDLSPMKGIHVDPSARRLCVGEKLIEAVAAVARQRGCLRLYWTTKEDNATALSLYDRIARFNGFIRYDYGLDAKRPE